MNKTIPARIRLFSAKDAPYVLVLRQKPSKMFHVIRWNTESDELEYGSWFKGKLFVEDCDLSFDGNWMVYDAIGARGDDISGLCRAPWINQESIVKYGPGTGGGVWLNSNSLCIGDWKGPTDKSPFEFSHYSKRKDVDQAVNLRCGFLPYRLERDGWKKVNGGFEIETWKMDKPSSNEYLPQMAYYLLRNHVSQKLIRGEWYSQPTPEYPALHITVSSHQSRHFSFQLDMDLDTFDDKVTWACWDAKNDLVFASEGILYRYTLHGLNTRTTSFRCNLEHLKYNPPNH